FYDDDDDDEYSIQVSEKSPIAITPVLPTKESKNSLSTGDEHLDTIPKMESDEVIKSSVEGLVPIPTEFEGILDNMCDVPFCDNSHPLDGELSSIAMEAILGEPRVYVPNVLPTHLTLYHDSDFSSSDDSLRSGHEVSFPSGTRNKVFDLGIFIEV
nr:hypothetical protein [Tanacetum cinerariifolium]